MNFQEIISQYILNNNANHFKHSGAIQTSKGNIYITKVIYNNPMTICLWSDGTKTSSRCQEGDIYNPELGLVIAFLKKIHGVEETVKLLEEWAPEKDQKVVSLSDVRRKERKSHN